MAILDILESKPAFFREFWEIPPFQGEPNCFNHRVSYRLPANVDLGDGERLHFSFGAALSSREAVQCCLGEAMERYSGYKRDLRKIRINSWKKLREEALHPEAMAGFSKAQLRSRSFPYAPFLEETRVGWIKGYSLVYEQDTWVPTQHVFLAPNLKTEVAVTPRISTGLACGSSREKAVIHGICEVIERDAFAIMWMNKLSMPLVDLGNGKRPDHPLNRLLEKKLARPRLQYRVIQITTDFGIPSYCAIVREEEKAWPCFVIGCACRLSAADAIKSALVDAATGRTVLLYHQKTAREITEGKPEMAVFKKVDRVQDHARVYADPRFSRYADFMWKSKIRISLDSLPDYSTGNPGKDLQTCLSILKKKGYDCIVVDITPREVAEYGLTVVRVMIPGTQPLHFGWHYEFLKNRRLYEAPKTLGYTEEPTTEKRIYRIPHPMM